MDRARFEEMVARLEAESQRSPAMYQFKVGLLTLLGFGLILLMMSFAGMALILIGGFAVLVVISGGKALLLLVKLGKLLVLVAITCWMLIRSSFSALFVRLPVPEGIELHRREAPALFAAMDDMRKRMRGPRFHHVLVTDEVNAAVVQRPLLGLFGFTRNYLILGLPLMESMTPEEMLAVVAHEYGHLAGSHGRFRAYIYRLRNTWGTIQDMSAQWSGWIGGRLHALVSWYAPYFNAYTFVLARANEYEADAASAELAGSAAAQSALKRVNLAAAHHDRFLEATYKKVNLEPSPPGDLAMRWAGVASLATAEANAQEWLVEALERQPHFADTHPGLAQRLQALSADQAGQEMLPSVINGDTAANAWLGTRAATLRLQLQDAWCARITNSWKERHAELQEQMTRLVTLREQSSRTEDEEIEVLRLQLDLEPENDNLSALVAFNAAHPDRPLTLFWEAGLRLGNDDETGLSLLDRVMALDAAATKAVCEKAYAWLLRKDTERAEIYKRKWNERDEWEQRRHVELENLDEDHAFVHAELAPQVLEHVRAVLREHGKGIAKAWLARRVIPSDADAMTYVIGFKPTLLARLLRREAKIMTALVKAEWPMHAFICNTRINKKMDKRLRAVPGVELAISG